MDTIGRLIEKYGPAIVAAAQRQVQVAILQDIVWLAIGLVLAGLLVVWVPRLWRLTDDVDDVDDFDRNMARGFLGGGAGLASAVVFGLFIARPIGEIWTYAANPDWAVIHEISKIVKL